MRVEFQHGEDGNPIVLEKILQRPHLENCKSALSETQVESKKLQQELIERTLNSGALLTRIFGEVCVKYVNYFTIIFLFQLKLSFNQVSSLFYYYHFFFAVIQKML